MKTFEERMRAHRHFRLRRERPCAVCRETLYPDDDVIAVESNSGRVVCCGHDCAEAAAEPKPIKVALSLLESVL